MSEASRGGIGLALGSGGARGLAHVVVLEAFDELGIRPAAIAGTSIGAILGAAYAAGLSGRDLRGQLLRVLGRRHRALSALLDARVGRFTQLLRGGLTNPVLVDAETVLAAFWPASLPERIEDLAIPFTAIATDFHGREERVLRAGPLRGAVAASMAIPGLVRPVLLGGRTLVDGAATNPLPYDRLPASCAAVVACDIVAGPVGEPGTLPSPFEAMFGSAQIMQVAITARMVRERPPDLLLRPQVNGFKVLDFFAFSRILRAAEVDKDSIKRGIERLLDPPPGAAP